MDNAREAVAALNEVYDLKSDLELSPGFEHHTINLMRHITDVLRSNRSDVISNVVKETLNESLGGMLSELANDIRVYYSMNHFEVTDEVIPIMREVVKINNGG